LSSIAEPVPRGRASTPLQAAIRLHAVFFFALFATNFDIFLSAHGLLPVNSIAILLGAIVIFFFLVAFSGRFTPFLDSFCKALISSRVPILLFTLWVAVHALNAARAVISGPETDFTRIFPILQFGLLILGIAFAAAKDLSSSYVRIGLASTIAVLGSSVIVQTVFPGILGTLDPRASPRAGGFALNANVAAFILTAALACFLDFRRARGSDLLALLFTLVAVICTLSRSGLGQYLIVAVAYFLVYGKRVFREHGRVDRLAFVAKVVLMPLVLVGILAALGLILSAGQPEIRERIETLTLRGDAVYEDPYRYMLLEHYFRLALEHPFVGFGTAYTTTTAVFGAPHGFGPHNMYLRAWIDHGLVGLGLYVAMLLSLLVTYRARRNINGAFLVLLVAGYSLFAHDPLDTKAMLLFAGVALGQSFRSRRD
jgi:O-antigen ligase